MFHNEGLKLPRFESLSLRPFFVNNPALPQNLIQIQIEIEIGSTPKSNPNPNRNRNRYRVSDNALPRFCCGDPICGDLRLSPRIWSKSKSKSKSLSGLGQCPPPILLWRPDLRGSPALPQNLIQILIQIEIEIAIGSRTMPSPISIWRPRSSADIPASLRRFAFCCSRSSTQPAESGHPVIDLDQPSQIRYVLNAVFLWFFQHFP